MTTIDSIIAVYCFIAVCVHARQEVYAFVHRLRSHSELRRYRPPLSHTPPVPAE